MKRIDAYIHDNQYNFIATQSGTLSEHLRRALDDYIEKLKSQKVSASQSKPKGGDNG